jgi:hypothetical protein
MIPEWLTNGDLPAGVHFATLREIEDRLNFNPRRQRLLAGFQRACEQLLTAGCGLVYLDGSFVTRKEHPGTSMPVGTCRTRMTTSSTRSSGIFREAVRRRSNGSWASSSRAQLPEGATGRAFIDFFQVNKLSGEPKGIVAVRLGRGGRK